MKKLFAIALALICLVMLFTMTPIRIARGEVDSHTYIESAGCINTCLVTTDGEMWVAEGYTAPIGDNVLIIYDRCDRGTLYDDEIMYIVHFTKF